MKTCTLFFAIMLILIVACAPQSTVMPAPTLAITNTPPPTESPPPTQTLEPTPMSIPVSEISLDSCKQILEAKISSAGVLEIVYASTDGSTKQWSEGSDAQKVVSVPIPSDGEGPILSSDHRHILFERASGESQRELWVIDADGRNEKRLTTIRYDDTLVRYSTDLVKYGGSVFPSYDWVPNTDKIFYYVGVYLSELGPPLYDKFVLVDIDSGQAIPLAIPPFIKIFEFSPDERQMAILTDGELRVLSTENGRTQFTVQASLDYPIYSPHGKFIIDFVDEGILRIDARNGQGLVIPLKYTMMSANAEGPSIELPDFTWTDDSNLLLTSLNSDKRYVSLIPFLFKPDPGWSFTVWHINMISGETEPIHAFSGDPSTAIISPGGKRLAYQKYEVLGESIKRSLLLADLTTGEILETIAGGVFKAWLPDSDKYLYATGFPYPPPGKGDPGAGKVDIKYYLGQIGKEPTFVNWNEPFYVHPSSGWWVDEHRMVINCKIVTFP